MEREELKQWLHLEMAQHNLDEATIEKLLEDAQALEQPEMEPAATEPAPPNSLPSRNECALRVDNSDFVAKRVSEGGYGAENDSILANALHRFIYEYDDADPYRSSWFLHRLEQVVNECTPPQRLWVGLTDEEFQLIYDMGRTPTGMMEMVEAKLKDKNNG